MQINVVCGANTHNNVTINGSTVGAVRSELSLALNIPSDTSAFVSGVEVGDDYTLSTGATVEFRKTSGSKA